MYKKLFVMEKISREDYLKALDIVEAFHLNLFEERRYVEDAPVVAIRISGFLAEEEDLPVRVYDALKRYKEVAGDVYIEKVCKFDFIKMRNVGKKTWIEFCDIRGDFLNNKRNYFVDE